MRLFLALILAVPLAACLPDEEAPPTQDDACGAAVLQGLVGQLVAGQSFDAPSRIIPPGSAVTMDHRPDRLNIETDAQGIITRIYCG